MIMNKLIKSYVWSNDKCFFVSSINRPDTLSYTGVYAETMIWEYDYYNNERGELVGQVSDVKNSLNAHFAVCEELQKNGFLKECDD
jgi:hypothetical protein